MDTFLVRIWTEAEGAAEVQGPAAPRLRGTVRHVRSGSEWRFADAAELLAVLGSASRSRVPAGSRPPREADWSAAAADPPGDGA
ncbi:MAG: hypothetical protein FIA92_12310 [Chloroflexi bacterium]|nr:hypothetical protein [Chloroflexota bacterium]